VLLTASSLIRAADLKVKELYQSRVGDTTYFQVRIESPKDLRLPEMYLEGTSIIQRRLLAQLPRLVPQNDRASAVWFHIRFPLDERPYKLEFLGKFKGDKPAELVLYYPTDKKAEPLDKEPSLVPELHGVVWAKATLKLDIKRAKTVVRPDEERTRRSEPSRDDLEGLWADAQAWHLAQLESLTPESGFYGVAREATGRRWKVPAEAVQVVRGRDRFEERRLYEMTTGAAALTESLALGRMLNGRPGEKVERSIAVDTIRGIDVAEHPWEKMMGGKKPAEEPLAWVTPHDQYYVTFRNVRAFAETAALLDQWGGNLQWAVEQHSRDYRLRQRYERQLCLDVETLSGKLDKDLVRGLALTGSDPYLRDGSDLSVIFHVSDKVAFRRAVAPLVERARDQYGRRLHESAISYRGVAIDSFVTARREVSLYRAEVGPFIICSNSPVAIRRILDTHAGRRKALADALDFRYMRTVFRRDDKSEDAFAYLPDAFIRHLVGPAAKIKEKRRLEAQASLQLATSGALFTAWETGKLPSNHRQMIRLSGLRSEELATPEGDGVVWDGDAKLAVSDAYNTIQFVTPLLELPIDRVTRQEARDYASFRDEYTRLWRRYFDPVGIRLSLADKQVKLETYILPLIQSSEYNALREWVGGPGVILDLSRIPPATLLQFAGSLSPTSTALGDQWNKALGDQFLFRWQDSPVYRKIIELWVRQELEGPGETLSHRQGQLFYQLPFTIGIKIGDKKVFDELLRQVENLAISYARGHVERLKPYRGVTISHYRCGLEGPVANQVNDRDTPEEKRFVPNVYYATIDGVWYLSFRQEVIRELVDLSVDRRDDRRRKETELLNTSFRLEPGAAPKATAALGAYVEWQAHRRALSGEPMWYALHRAGVISADADAAQRDAAALHYLGYVPISPDGAAYRYHAASDEVVNERHGSLSQPRLHGRLAADAPIARLLKQWNNLQADLRFREDGIHTTLTLERNGKK
jgi:hypothetical protein